LLWQSGCGVKFEEVFIEGTEPDQRCQRRIEIPPLLIDFEEPPVISPEEAAERATGLPSLDDVQIIIDPAPASRDESPDVLDEKEREEIDRQLEGAMRELEKLREQAPQIGTPPTFDPRDARQDEKREEKEERREEKDQRKEEKRDDKEERKPDEWP
jgi:hypothetical protein